VNREREYSCRRLLCDRIATAEPRIGRKLVWPVYEGAGRRRQARWGTRMVRRRVACRVGAATTCQHYCHKEIQTTADAPRAAARSARTGRLPIRTCQSRTPSAVVRAPSAAESGIAHMAHMTSRRCISYTATDQNIKININILSHLILPRLALYSHASRSALLILILNLTQQQ
jgi:hypothetical protein